MIKMMKIEFLYYLLVKTAVLKKVLNVKLF